MLSLQSTDIIFCCDLVWTSLQKKETKICHNHLTYFQCYGQRPVKVNFQSRKRKFSILQPIITEAATILSLKPNLTLTVIEFLFY